VAFGPDLALISHSAVPSCGGRQPPGRGFGGRSCESVDPSLRLPGDDHFRPRDGGGRILHNRRL